jgi:hypothetical protein
MKALVPIVYCNKCKRQMEARIVEEYVRCLNKTCQDYDVKWEIPTIELNLKER